MSERNIIPVPEDFLTWPELDQDIFLMRKRWLEVARPKQVPPPGDWWIWLLMAGRGFGKTRIAAEDVAFSALANDNWKIGVIGQTFSAMRDVCFEGESGILSCLSQFGPHSSNKYIDKWNRSTAELFMTNGTVVKGFSGDEPDRIRGYQFHRTWVDELAAMPLEEEVWEQVEMTGRLGPDPRIIVTTTPQAKSKILRELVQRSFPRTVEEDIKPLDASANNVVPGGARNMSGASAFFYHALDMDGL